LQLPFFLGNDIIQEVMLKKMRKEGIEMKKKLTKTETIKEKCDACGALVPYDSLKNCEQCNKSLCDACA
jgi:hypothetical protein